jgi:hypothetical protein
VKLDLMLFQMIEVTLFGIGGRLTSGPTGLGVRLGKWGMHPLGGSSTIGSGTRGKYCIEFDKTNASAESPGSFRSYRVHSAELWI